ncbi:MAG: heavy-metal-associated domain-containing protein [Lachnospiraceae bacterium]|nr:heavy-metal-associated domain-containing protein [Lachnospiraceae bacterium]
MVKTTLKIDGMMCSMCEAHINEAIRKAVTVKKVKSSHKKGESVIISDEAIDEQSIRKAIGDTGYELTGFSAETYEKKGLFHS